jgi:hypothetical protein
MLDALVEKISAQAERTEDRVLQLEKQLRTATEAHERVVGQFRDFAEQVKGKIDALVSLATASKGGGDVPQLKPAALRDALDADWSQSGPLNPQ